jgi:hypothetical protein
MDGAVSASSQQLQLTWRRLADRFFFPDIHTEPESVFSASKRRHAG